MSEEVVANRAPLQVCGLAKEAAAIHWSDAGSGAAGVVSASGAAISTADVSSTSDMVAARSEHRDVHYNEHAALKPQYSLSGVRNGESDEDDVANPAPDKLTPMQALLLEALQEFGDEED